MEAEESIEISDRQDTTYSDSEHSWEELLAQNSIDNDLYNLAAQCKATKSPLARTRQQTLLEHFPLGLSTIGIGTPSVLEKPRNKKRRRSRQRRRGVEPPPSTPTPRTQNPTDIANNGKAWDLVLDQLHESSTHTHTRKMVLNFTLSAKKRKKEKLQLRKQARATALEGAPQPTADDPANVPSLPLTAAKAFARCAPYTQTVRMTVKTLSQVRR
jgi:hypothetical protein